MAIAAALLTKAGQGLNIGEILNGVTDERLAGAIG
jgi:hypothetical protein